MATVNHTDPTPTNVAPLSGGHQISAYDVPAVLAFLSWHVPLPDAIPNEDERDSIECGRAAILDACRAALRTEEADHD